MLLLSEDLVATNIINDKRRDLIIEDAGKLMEQEAAWSDIRYPLGKIMSNANGDCRVIYQYFNAATDHGWIGEALSLINAGNNAWIAFKKGTNNSGSTIAALADVEIAELSDQLTDLFGINAAETWSDLNKKGVSGSRVLYACSEQILLLPISVPMAPIIVIGRHRVAIETVRQLALLPVSVEWFAEGFCNSDPSGPRITKQSMSDLHLSFKQAKAAESTAAKSGVTVSRVAGSAVVIMSNDHQHDLQLCKMALVQTSLNFVGCIGSTRKAELLKERLLANGISQSQLDRLHIPIGLPAITGKHPSLIAASVVAQLLTLYEAGREDHFSFFER